MYSLTRTRKAMILLIVATMLALALSVMTSGTAAGDDTAQVQIPEGAKVRTAALWIYATEASKTSVSVHEVTVPWEEDTVTWNSFGGNYDTSIIGSFGTYLAGWKRVDVTATVQEWVNGISPNYGFLLEQGQTPFTSYHSSEYSQVNLRPKLVIHYTRPGGGLGCVVIQRAGAEPDGVADAYIWANNKNANYGERDALYTGLIKDGEKQTLLRFDFGLCPPGVRNHCYWKIWGCQWPVEEITIGGIQYSKNQAIHNMWAFKPFDKTYAMFRELAAAKLNVAIGNPSECVQDAIDAADQWLVDNPLGSGVAPWATPWTNEGQAIFQQLQQYNTGSLCAPPA